jgi:hypothetical protein
MISNSIAAMRSPPPVRQENKLLMPAAFSPVR